MMNLSRLVTAAVVAVALVATPASAEHGGPHPTARTERVYFHCAGGDPFKLQNSGAFAGLYPSWDTTPPTRSATAGGGCGTFDNNIGGNYFDGLWRGSFTGNLASLTVEVYVVEPGQAQAQGRYGLPFTLVVDGETITSTRIDFPVAPTGAAFPRKLVFSVTGLPFLFENGDGTIERRIELRLANFKQGTWVFDATEVPAGITFNPEQTESFSVRAGG